jgi:hypothetical protein
MEHTERSTQASARHARSASKVESNEHTTDISPNHDVNQLQQSTAYDVDDA